MILLARSTPLAEAKRQSEGMSIFMADLRAAERRGMTARPIPGRVNHETNERFFGNLETPAENLIGEVGKGFRYSLDALNADPALSPAGCIGDGHGFIDRASQYVGERIVFCRPIVADRIYPHWGPEPAPGAAPDDPQPLQLLAREFSFTDPISGQRRCFVSQRRLRHAPCSHSGHGTT